MMKIIGALIKAWWRGYPARWRVEIPGGYYIIERQYGLYRMVEAGYYGGKGKQ